MVTSFLEMVGYTYVMSFHKYHRTPCNWIAWTPEIWYNVPFFSIGHTDQTHPCIPVKYLSRISVKRNWDSSRIHCFILWNQPVLDTYLWFTSSARFHAYYAHEGIRRMCSCATLRSDFYKRLTSFVIILTFIISSYLRY